MINSANMHVMNPKDVRDNAWGAANTSRCYHDSPLSMLREILADALVDGSFGQQAPQRRVRSAGESLKH